VYGVTLSGMRVTTADSPLTVKQTKFAAKVANGTPKAVAHREVYVSQREPKAQQRRALETAAKPNVAAEIRRLTWLSCPPIENTRGMREHAVRVLSDLSRTAVSEEVRFKSALALFKIAETTRAASDPRAEATEQDKLLASLRKLYAEVQGRAGDDTPDIGPRSREPDDEAIDIDCIAAPVTQEPAAQEPDSASQSQEPASAQTWPAEPVSE